MQHRNNSDKHKHKEVQETRGNNWTENNVNKEAGKKHWGKTLKNTKPWTIAVSYLSKGFKSYIVMPVYYLPLPHLLLQLYTMSEMCRVYTHLSFISQTTFFHVLIYIIAYILLFQKDVNKTEIWKYADCGNLLYELHYGTRAEQPKRTS